MVEMSEISLTRHYTKKSLVILDESARVSTCNGLTLGVWLTIFNKIKCQAFLHLYHELIDVTNKLSAAKKTTVMNKEKLEKS